LFAVGVRKLDRFRQFHHPVPERGLIVALLLTPVTIRRKQQPLEAFAFDSSFDGIAENRRSCVSVFVVNLTYFQRVVKLLQVVFRPNSTLNFLCWFLWQPQVAFRWFQVTLQVT